MVLVLKNNFDDYKEFEEWKNHFERNGRKLDECMVKKNVSSNGKIEIHYIYFGVKGE